MANINVLTSERAYLLTEWVTTNAVKLDRMPCTKIAELAAKEVGFPVTAANVTNVINVLHKCKKRSPAPAARSYYGKAGSNSGKNLYIARALRDLMLALGHPVPRYLTLCCGNEATSEVSAAFFAECGCASEGDGVA